MRRPLLVALLSLLGAGFHANTFAAPPARREAAPTASPAPAEYGLEQARVDLQTTLTGKGREYLAARGRLGDHPQAAREAALEALEALEARVAKLEATGAWQPDTAVYVELQSERGRLVAVLGEAKSPEDAPRFAQALERAYLDGQPEEPWRHLLVGLGPGALPELAKLVANPKLEQPVRVSLLEDLVDVTPAERLSSLTAQLGRGDREMEHALRRALVRRSRSSVDERDRVVAALDVNLGDDTLPAAARAAALLVRARAAFDDTFTGKLEAWAVDESAPFELRTAALDALSRAPKPPGPELDRLVATHLGAQRRGTQRSEILASLGLAALPAERARKLVVDNDLTRARPPRLASWGWKLAPVDPSGDWIGEAMEHAWPEVRREALARVGKACGNVAQRELAKRAGPRSRGGDSDSRVARAAAEAMGRCGLFDELEALLEDSGVGFEQRGSVARVLARDEVPGGADRVAALLRSNIPSELAARLADALAATPSPSPAVLEVLCARQARDDSAAIAARRTLQSLKRADACSAEESR